MQLDGPLMGRAEPQVQSFNAIIHMVRLDGNILHEHEISNFTQHSVSYTGDAITTFNGTFSVSMREGIINDVPGYIQFTGDLVGIWLDPIALENHFGPTPIQGMVLPPTEGAEAIGSQWWNTSKKSMDPRNLFKSKETQQQQQSHMSG
ncbi:MAG: hypothetical protein M3M87_02470 [Thermoproteota archaeon]|nr:hypothetical protein [Thermoproteota archaeon]